MKQSATAFSNCALQETYHVMLPHFSLSSPLSFPSSRDPRATTHFQDQEPFAYHEIRKWLTTMNQSWILPFDRSPFYHYPSDSASGFGKLHAPGKAQRGNIWAEVSRHASIPQSRCWWCELGLVPWALTASLFINTTCAECDVLCSEWKPWQCEHSC